MRLCSSEGNDTISILYRGSRRPDCLLGWRMEAYSAEDDPRIWTTIGGANFMEHVVGTPFGLPEDCDPAGITWTDRG